MFEKVINFLVNLVKEYFKVEEFITEINFSE